MPTIDRDALETTMRAELRAAWATLHGRHPGERFYSFGLYTTDLAEYLSVTASTEEGLSAAVERHLPTYFASFGDTLPPPGLYHRILREIEHPLLTVTLAATRGNQIRAADLLGVNRNTLRKKIRDLDIQVFRSSG